MRIILGYYASIIRPPRRADAAARMEHFTRHFTRPVKCRGLAPPPVAPGRGPGRGRLAASGPFENEEKPRSGAGRRLLRPARRCVAKEVPSGSLGRMRADEDCRSPGFASAYFFGERARAQCLRAYASLCIVRAAAWAAGFAWVEPVVAGGEDVVGLVRGLKHVGALDRSWNVGQFHSVARDPRGLDIVQCQRVVALCHVVDYVDGGPCTR